MAAWSSAAVMRAASASASGGSGSIGSTSTRTRRWAPGLREPFRQALISTPAAYAGPSGAASSVRALELDLDGLQAQHEPGRPDAAVVPAGQQEQLVANAEPVQLAGEALRGAPVA